MNFLQIVDFSEIIKYFTEIDVALWTLYATVIFGIITFIFNTISVRQTAKAQKDMARPYLNLYVDIAAVKDHQRFFVLKNFGTTPAYIRSIKLFNRSTLTDTKDQNPFKSLNGNMIAPGQKVTSFIARNLKDSYIAEIIYYDKDGKIYREKFKLNTMAFATLSYSSHNSGKNESATAIRQSTLALIRELKN